ncbi:MAG: MFS transporter [Dysgonamonadaceae bacterium]|jgi:DHA3 family macrolide efflux protein-like MFS transporter|nr:MFS transporter [Dysgonamonadaceae bacterium]
MIDWKKNTALFLTGQALSLLGTMVVQYAILWHVTLKSQSGTMMAFFTIAGFLPMFFISPFAGVWADRFNRKYIINIADGAIALVSLCVAVFLLSGFDSYGLLLFCALVRSLGQGVQTPAVGAFIPQIVPPEHLTKINGFQSSIHSFVNLISPMLSGALMTFTPLATLFFLDVVTAAIGIVIVFFFVKVPVKTKAPKQKETAYFHDLKEGLNYIKKHGYVLRMIVISALFTFLIAPAAFLTPLQVARNYGAEVWRLSAIEIVFSGGMIVGGIWIGMWGGFKNRIYTMAFSCLLCGLLSIGLGLWPQFWLYLVIMAVTGLFVPLYNAPSMVLLQTGVEPAFMGRVISVFVMVSSTMMPLGMLAFGPIADKVSIDMLLIVAGILISLLSIPMVTSKTLREAGKRHLQTYRENIRTTF